MRNKLVVYRLKLNMNQTEFAEYLGIRRELYNKYENHRVPIGNNQLVKIWLLLKRDIPDLHLEDLLDR